MTHKARIVTLAQLALLPKGTWVCHCNTSLSQLTEFDCQGILQVGALHRLGRVTDTYLELVPFLPDIRINEGRISTSYGPTSYLRDNEHPHRFVVYETEAKKPQRRKT